MAKGYKPLKITLDSIKENCKICSCPEIKILSVGDDILQGCCYNPKTKVIEGQVKTDPDYINDSACLLLEIKCNKDDCIESHRVKVCLCTGSEDCDECQSCVKGICVSRCDEGQHCDGDKCVDCLPGTCINGKVCLNGKCVCPPGSTMDGDRCIDCNVDTFDVPCKLCIDGKVVDKDCPDGVCDPSNDTCVDCLIKDHCTKANECCVDKSCECCSGYVRNTCTGECELLAPNACNIDSPSIDCNECTGFDPCTGYGTYTPTDCPANTICVFGQCLPECSCSERNCTTGGNSCADHPTQPGKCYCFNCGQNDCSDEGGECGPNSDKDACICTSQGCEPNPCNNKSCSSDFDCAFGCTCDGGKCKPCSQYSCDEQGSSACGGANSRNCTCNGAGECVGDPNAECNDTLTITKDVDNCQLVGLWNSEECCTCPDITVDIKPTISGENINFEYTLYKGSTVQTGFNLSNGASNDQIADTEEPTGGSFSATVIENIAIKNYVDGVLVSTVPSTITNAPTNIDNFTSGFLRDNVNSDTIYNSYPTGDITSGQVIELQSRKVEIRLNSPLVFGQEEGTECVYGNSGQLLLTVFENQLYKNHTVTLTSDECKPVYFIWKQDSVAFRKRYIKAPYVDTVGIDEGLLPCKDITLESDCGCDKLADNDSEFCNPDVSQVVVTPNDACRKEFTVTVPKSCPLNVQGDVALYLDFGATVVSTGQGASNGTQVVYGLTNSDTTFQVVLSSPSTGVDINLKCCE